MKARPCHMRTRALGEFAARRRRNVDVIPDEEYFQIGIRSHGHGIFHKPPTSGHELGNKRVFWLEPNDFVLNIVFAWEGAVALVSNSERGRIASHRFPTFKIDESICDRRYLLEYFKTKRGVFDLGLASPGGAGRNRTLNQSDFQGLKVPLPPVEEQNRIADISLKWDKAIDLTEHLIDALKKRKKGLMQRLLTGDVRFPEFRNSIWREVKFSDVLDVSIGRTPPRVEKKYWDQEKTSGNVWLSISDLQSKYVSDSAEYVSDEWIMTSAVRSVPADSVIMSFKLTIGRRAITTKELRTNEAICALIPKDKGVLSPRYLYHALGAVNFDREIDQAVKGEDIESNENPKALAASARNCGAA